MKSVSKFLQDIKKETLNPKFWNERKQLHKPVRDALVKIAYAWAEWCDIPRSAIADIHLVGGNASYFWNNKSDLDLHLIIDKEKVSECEGLLTDYLRSKKKIWQLEQDVTIYGAEVEVYAEDIEDPKPTRQGRYSLKSNKWVTKPVKELPEIDDSAVTSKVETFNDRIEDLIDDKVSDESILKRLKDKLMVLRSESLKTGGEYAFGNLVYKMLRNTGALDRLDRYMRGLVDQNLSLYK